MTLLEGLHRKRFWRSPCLFAIMNGGTLTDSTNSATVAMFGGSSFTMNGGTIKSGAEGVSATSVRNGIFTMNGGTIEAAKSNALNVSGGDCTISGGSVENNGQGGPQTIGVSGGSLKINSGAVTNHSGSVIAIAQSASGGSIDISGGTITSESNSWAVIAAGGTTTISNGTLNGGVINQGQQGTETTITGGIVTGQVRNYSAGEITIGSSNGAGPTIYGNVSNQGSSVSASGSLTVNGGSFSETSKFSYGVKTGSPFSTIYGDNLTNDTTLVDATLQSGATPTEVTATTVDGNAAVTFYGTSMPDLSNGGSGALAGDLGEVTVDSVATGVTDTSATTLDMPNDTKVVNDTGATFNVKSPQGVVTAWPYTTVTSAAPYVPVPGDPANIQNQVAGVVNPVKQAAASYADVVTNSSNMVWTIQAKESAGDTPIATVAEDIVAQVVIAIGRGGSSGAVSAQVETISVSLPGTDASVLSFSEQVVQASVPVPGGVDAVVASLPATATLSDLEGMTCGVVAQTNAGTITYTFNFVGEAPVPPEPTVDYVAVYRLYNPYDFLHIYTSDANEVASLRADGWTVDFNGQPCWYAPVAASEDAAYQVIRLYNPFSHDHYFVPASDTTQINELTGLGWQRDGAASSIWSAPADEGNVQVYTLFNPYNEVDTHLWTANRTEVDTLVGPDAWELNTTTLWGVTPA